MADPSRSAEGAASRPNRLDGWKEIAAFIGRGIRTAQRWERDYGLPVHRPGTEGAVVAFPAELDAWMRSNARPTVAVLPFENAGGDPQDAYFCEGLAEGLIVSLGRVDGLGVAARASAFQLSRQGLGVREVAERLKVKTVLEGTVRRFGDTLRVTAQLVNASDGLQLWAEVYDRSAGDVFAIQDEIARAVAAVLEGRPTRPTGLPIVRRDTENMEAYNLHLRARFLMNRVTSDIRASTLEAIRCLQAAIALDSRYAVAHATLAEAWNVLGYYSFVPASEASRASMEAARRALELDATLPEAHTALGWTKTLFAIDLRTAEQDFLRAIDLYPHAPAYLYYAMLLAAHGRIDEATTHVHHAQRLDPLWMVVPFAIAQVNLCAGRFEAVERQMRDLLSISPEFAGASWYLANALAGQGRFDEATAALEPAAQRVGRVPLYLAVLGICYARAGRHEDARALIAEVRRATRPSHCALALILGATGDVAEAFAHLRAAVEHHEDQVFMMATDPRFVDLRGDPRFDALLHEMGVGHAR